MRHGVVLHQEEGSRVETGVDRTDLVLHFYSTSPFANHFWHCHWLTVVFSVHGVSSPVEKHGNQLSAGPFLVPYLYDIPHSFKFFQLEVQLSSLALGAWGLTFGYCILGGAAFGVAFLSIIFSVEVVWTSLEVRLIILSNLVNVSNNANVSMYVNFNNGIFLVFFVEQCYLIYTSSNVNLRQYHIINHIMYFFSFSFSGGILS